MFQNIVILFRRVRGLFPSKLPTGLTEFNAWIAYMQTIYNLPTTNADDISFSFAAMIMHLGPTCDRKSNWYFVKCFNAGAAKQIAGAAFQQVKERQKATAAELAAKDNVPQN